MLSESLLDLNLIFPKIEAKDRVELLKKLGTKLKEKNYVKDDFIEALLKREKDYPTGIEVNNYGVAIPHVDAKYVLKTKIVVATLKKPVKFELMGCDEGETYVDIVFLLAVKDPKRHILFLQKLMKIVQNDELLYKIKNSNESNYIKKVIEQFLV